jgi:hypothetical protein
VGGGEGGGGDGGTGWHCPSAVRNRAPQSSQSVPQPLHSL